MSQRNKKYTHDIVICVLDVQTRSVSLGSSHFVWTQGAYIQVLYLLQNVQPFRLDHRSYVRLLSASRS